MGKKKSKQRHTPLKAHTRLGTKLVPPLAKLNVSLVAYERDLLPEHLWLASLVETFGTERAHRPFYDLMDALDPLWTPGFPAIGLLSDFGHVSESVREDFKRKHGPLIRAAFHEPIGRPLAFYPDCPAYWLIDQDALREEGPLDPEVELPKLRSFVIQLMPGKDEFAGHVRALPIGRVLKHGKLHFPSNFDLVDALPKYPAGCTDEEKRRVQSFARTMINMDYEHIDRYADRAWPKYFWRHNYDLLLCRPATLPIRGARPIGEIDAPRIAEILKVNAARARAYLELLGRQVRVDLYDPEKEEILFGLFARCVRLYVLMAEDANLWARDTVGIMLRCLADSAITFCYLSKCGSTEEFQRFKEYGEGQEKLLMLHLQDSYSEATSLEGRTGAAIGEELGSFTPELIQVELGSWAKQDSRKLAQKAGLERLYRLVFAPGSSDVHGSWMSLKHSNLSYCAEALHRFHRLPAFSEPPVYVNAMLAAQELLEACIATAVEHLRFPKLNPTLDDGLRVLAHKGEQSDEEQDPDTENERAKA